MLLEIRVKLLIKSVVDQYYLGLALLKRMLSQEDVGLVRIAVHESSLEDLGVKDRRNELRHLSKVAEMI